MGEAREISNAMIGALLSYVRRAGGEDAIEATLALAGEKRPLALLNDYSSWSSYDQVHAIYSAAVLVMSDPEVGRKAGEELVSTPDAMGMAAYLHNLGGPKEIIALVSEICAKHSTVTEMEMVRADQNSALVAARTKYPITRDRLFCGYTSGLLSRLPWLYGMEPADVTEVQCQARGDSRCIYKVVWDPTTRPEEDPDRHIEYLHRQITMLTDRVESLESAAADLATAADIDTVLQTIVMRSSLAARGHTYVLAVRLPGERDFRIHCLGCTEQEGRVRAAEILGNDLDVKGGSRLVVDVASARHKFGRLAVFYPEGFSFLPHEHRSLRAYAGHAAAALETASALDEARRRGDTLGATLELASAVAQARTSAEVAGVLSAMSSSLVECSLACVLLWEAADEIFVRAGEPNQQGTSPALRAPHLANRFTRTPEPVMVERVSNDPALAGMLALTGMGSALLVPIISRHELFAVLALGAEEKELPSALRIGPDSTLAERLAGIASIAAPAFTNARLLAQVEYEALHDPLTGLPNTRLLQDEMVRALAHAERQNHQCALLFVDLDRFRDVNDTLGHVGADDVLRAVALIMRSAVRRGDVVARLAGDQFAIVLPHVRGPRDAELVANKIISALGIPFDDFERPVSVPASVGVAVFPEHGHSFDDLLGRADAAMREAKANGGSRFLLGAAR